MDVVEQELKEQVAFERMEDSLGLVRGVKKCRKCHENKSSSEFDTYIDKNSQERRKEFCKDCVGTSGYDNRKLGKVEKRKNTNWRQEYVNSIKDFQALSTLCSQMYRLLVDARQSMNGSGYKVDTITEEYKRLIGE